MPTDIWGNVTGGASGSGSVYDTVISTTVWGNAQGGAAGVVNSASNAAASAAASAAAMNAVSDVILAQAQMAARGEWQRATGSVAGYENYESSILSQAILKLGQLATGQYAQATGLMTNEQIDRTAASTAQAALQSGAGIGLGALLGSGTVLLIGGGILLLVLLKR